MMPLFADAAPIFVSAGSILESVFGGDVPDRPLELYQVAARALAVYIVGVVLARYGKSRMLTRTTTVDVLIGILLGSLLSRGVTGQASMSGTIVASIAIVAAHYALTRLAWHSHALGNLVKGHARLIVKDGQPLTDAMRQSHISDHDLIEHLRLNGVDDIALVRAAYKERNGEISVIKRESPPQIIDVAVKDGVQTVRIALT